jgi:hypothetical protein
MDAPRLVSGAKVPTEEACAMDEVPGLSLI